MQREEFRASLGRLKDLVALAGTVKVESYKRTTKTGKVVDVQAYTRSVSGMSNPELFKEYKDLSTGKADIPDQQKRTRLAQVTNEIRSRKDKGEWGTKQDEGSKKTPAAPETEKAEKAEAPEAGKSEKDSKSSYAGDTHKKRLSDMVRQNTDQEEEDPSATKASEAANRINARAIEAEKSASAALQSVVKDGGGTFFGWEHRLKTIPSLTRKIRDRAEDRYKSEEDPWGMAEANIGDSLRYTVVAKPDAYTDMAKGALEKLEQEGHKVLKVDNFWGDKGDYYGAHADMQSPDGLQWELQFHTPDSMTRKDASHFWYDFSRDRSLPPEVRVEAKERSAGAWKGLQRPTGWDSFGTMKNDPSEDDYIGGSSGNMEETSVPPQPPSPQGWPIGHTVTWGDREFRKTSEGWAYIGPA